MPAPSNISPSTATAIASFPYAVTVAAADLSAVGTDATFSSSCEGTGHHALWWKYTAQDGDVAIAVLGFPSGDYNTADLFPIVSVWVGTPPALTEQVFSGDQSCNGGNNPVLIPLTAGETYYIQVESDTGSSYTRDLLFTVQLSPRDAAVAGSILVFHELPGIPATVLDATTGAILRMVDLPAASFGWQLDDGTILLNDNAAAGTLKRYSYIDGALVLQQTIATWNGKDVLVTGAGTNFYVSVGNFNATKTLHQISSAGVVSGTTWTLPSTADRVGFIAVNPAETILYHGKDFGSTDTTIRAYDLNGSAALSDLVAADPDFAFVAGLLVLANGTLVAGVYKSGSPSEVRSYNSSGTLLATRTDPTGGTRVMEGLNPASSSRVWARWVHAIDGNDVATFDLLTATTMALVRELDTIYNVDSLFGPFFDTGDGPRFGPSENAFVLLLAQGLEALPEPLMLSPTPRCATTAPQVVTITGTGFTDDTVVTVTDPNGDDVHVEILAVTTTTIRVRLPFVVCGVYTLAVDAATFTVTTEACECCMSTEIALINQALYKIGVSKSITSTSERSREAMTAVALYADTLDEVLRDFPWAFATRYADSIEAGTGEGMELLDGTATAAVNGDWRYTYRYPDDCVFARRIVPSGAEATGRVFDDGPIPFRVGRTKEADPSDEILLVYCNEADAVLEYTVRTECRSNFPDALFEDAFSWKLASKLAPSLSKMDRMALLCLQMYTATLDRASAVSSREQQQEKPGDAEWIRGR